jgi:hypothetical protein
MLLSAPDTFFLDHGDDNIRIVLVRGMMFYGNILLLWNASFSMILTTKGTTGERGSLERGPRKRVVEEKKKSMARVGVSPHEGRENGRCSPTPAFLFRGFIFRLYFWSALAMGREKAGKKKKTDEEQERARIAMSSLLRHDRMLSDMFMRRSRAFFFLVSLSTTQRTPLIRFIVMLPPFWLLIILTSWIGGVFFLPGISGSRGVCFSFR